MLYYLTKHNLIPFELCQNLIIMKKHTQLTISAILQTLTTKSITIVKSDEAKEVKGGWITNTDLDQV